VRFDPYHLALADDLNRTHNSVYLHRHNETHITMLRKGRIGFQQYTADAYVIADGLNPRKGVARRKLHLDGIAYGETTVLAFWLVWPANVVGFSHNLCLLPLGRSNMFTLSLTPPPEYEGALSERTVGWTHSSDIYFFREVAMGLNITLQAQSGLWKSVVGVHLPRCHA
jgi:hypothetical protein